jgi:hypothetical protein
LAPELLDEHTKRFHTQETEPIHPSAPAANVDESQTIIEWIQNHEARHGIDTMCIQLLKILEHPPLTPNDARETLRTLRPAAAAVNDNNLQTQAARAIRALIWQRAGCPESATVEAKELIWKDLRDYLATKGVKA